MRKLFVIAFVLISLAGLYAQNRTVLIPRTVGLFHYNGEGDYLSKSFTWFVNSEIDSGLVYLEKVIEASGFTLDPNNYYVVVANFTDKFSPIGIIGKDVDFLGTRLYGLKEDNLYYIFVSQTDSSSFISVLATAKDSPFVEALPGFLGFIGVLTADEIKAQAAKMAGEPALVEVRQFTVPRAFQKFSDLSFMVKKNLSDEHVLARVVIDNTAKERWSFGVAFALTNVRDVDIIVGNDGTIIVQPKPNADPAVFGVVNYHFFPVDTKAKNFGNSIHALAGVRIGNLLEPLVGLGGGVSLGILDVYAFVGYSFEFANELKAGYEIEQKLTEQEDPFKLKVRGKLRFGLEVKFP